MLQKKVLERISKIQETNFNKFAQYQNDFQVLQFPHVRTSVENPYWTFLSEFSSHIQHIFDSLELQVVGIPAFHISQLVTKNQSNDCLKPEQIAKKYDLDLILIDTKQIRRFKRGGKKLCCLKINDTYSRVVGHYLYLLYLKLSLLKHVRTWRSS